MGQYLEPAAGTPSFALYDILRKPLRAAVRALLQEVKETNPFATRAARSSAGSVRMPVVNMWWTHNPKLSTASNTAAATIHP